ncbi:MAG: TIGR03435 family protein [Acidobacteriota bacterium]
MNKIRCALTVALAIVAAAFEASAQSAAKPVFEVAAVKPGNPASRISGIVDAQGGQLIAENVSLHDLIVWAYDLKRFQLSNSSTWEGSKSMNSARFSIAAKAEESASKAQMRLMLRSLLTERFKLALRVDMKEQTIYQLMVNGTPKMKATPAGKTGGFSGKPDAIGVFRFAASRMTMAVLAGFLSSQLEAIVEDRTGLTEGYDFEFEAPDAGNFAPALPQIGLKLEPRKGPVPFYVVEGAEPPSEN